MTPRPQRPPYFLYALLAVLATLGLATVGLGALRSYNNLAHGTELPDTPFYNGLIRGVRLTPAQAQAAGVPADFVLVTVTSVTKTASDAGLHVGDAVYTLNGRPYTGTSVLLEYMVNHHPGDTLEVTSWRAGTPLDAPPLRLALRLAPQRPTPATAWAWLIQLFFTLLPVFCLLTGLYVVLARPRNGHTWLVLGVLAYIGALLIHADQQSPFLLIATLVWDTLGQSAMPICFMLLGLYFPQRSRVDVRAPWLKWVLMVPTLALLPLDFAVSLAEAYRFSALAPLLGKLGPLNGFENLMGALQISLAFACLWMKQGDPKATHDARRRLRILITGCQAGLLPFFGLLVYSVVRGRDFGDGVPQWILLTALSILFIFPLTLAYVVIVQRALDLRILIRQGTKYFFARQSILVVAILLATWMSYSISVFIGNRGHQRAVDIVRIVAIVGLFIAYRSVGAKRLQRWIDLKFFREAYSTEYLLAEISDEARNFTETAPLLANITQRISATLHIDRIAVFLRTGDVFQLQFATGVPIAPGYMPALPAASTTILNLTRGKAPANVYRDDPASWLVDATDAERTALADLSTELLVPLPGRNRLVGVIALGPKRSEEPYTRTDRQLLQTIASQTGLALENAELLENLTVELAQRASIQREIEIAREVQERLFPQVYPNVPGIDLAGYCRPAQFVGGDYYDFFLIPQSGQQPGEVSAGRLAIAIGDISGKGISAALLMASLRASLRSVATLRQPDGAGNHQNLAVLMQHVNRLVYEASTSNRYATFFYAELDPATLVLEYVNAGHNCPVILRRGHPALQLQPTGTVVGLLPEAEYAQANVQLEPGDTLLAFTDGISEAMTADDEEWGEDRMTAAAERLILEPGCTRTARQLLDCLLSEADTFTAGAAQHDDMTLMLCTLAARL